MRRAVFLNGPPRSGKDTAAAALEKAYQHSPHYARNFKFSKPLKDACSAFMLLNSQERRYVEQQKEQQLDLLYGFSWRHLQIALSEVWAKRAFSSDIFGKLMVRQLTRSPSNLCIFSDSGFLSETQPVIDFLGKSNVLLIHLQRDDCTFEGDSRSYWELDQVTTVEVYNRLSKEMYEAQIVRVVEKWLEQQN